MGLFRRKSEDPLDPQLAVQREKERKAAAEAENSLSEESASEEEDVSEPEEENLSHVTVFGPAGIATEFDIKSGWEWADEDGDGKDILGETPEGKAFTTAGLGGSFFAIIKER